MSAGIRITLRNNEIISNTAKGHKEYSGGGGLYIGSLLNGQHVIEGNLFIRNQLDGAYYGGGIALYNSSPLIKNNIFHENSGRYGAGLFLDNSSNPQVVNNTFYGNSASSQGGGIYSRNSTLNVMNTIIWNSTAPTGAQIYRTGGSANVVYSDIQDGWAGDGNINIDPMFTDTLFHLSHSSRCIGAGIASHNFSGTVIDAPGYDIEGNPRPDPEGSRPDIGALENPRAYPLLSAIQIPDDYETIQAGIDAADDGDTVLVADGTYYENLTITSKYVTLASYFLMDEDTKHIAKTIIDGSQPANTDNAGVIMILNTQVPNTICGFTLTGGTGRKKVFPGGYTQIGGGIYIEESSAIIKNNHIINNSIISEPQALGTVGGGIFWGAMVTSGLTLEISGNLISGNEIRGKMSNGGGIIISNDLVGGEMNYLVEDNIIENNTVINTDEWKAMGGGISLAFFLPTEGTQIIRNNIISNNQAVCDNNVSSAHHSFGGGMYIVLRESISSGSEDNDPGPYIYNNLIYGNHSDHLGGGVSVWRTFYPIGSPGRPLTSAGNYVPKPSFINNTIVDNTAQDGSGFYIMNDIPFLMNNILWNDYPQNAVWGEIFLGDEPWWLQEVEPNKYGGAEIYYTDIQGGWDKGYGNMNSDPAFTDSINYYLSEGSLCIDAGYDNSIFNDIENGGFAVWPAMKGVRNDLGAYGGPKSYNLALTFMVF